MYVITLNDFWGHKILTFIWLTDTLFDFFLHTISASGVAWWKTKRSRVHLVVPHVFNVSTTRSMLFHVKQFTIETVRQQRLQWALQTLSTLFPATCFLSPIQVCIFAASSFFSRGSNVTAHGGRHTICSVLWIRVTLSHAGLFSPLPQSLVFRYLLTNNSTSTNERSQILHCYSRGVSVLSAHWSQSRRGLAVRLP